MNTRKSDYELYLVSRKHAGKPMTSKEALKIFGYSKSTYICDTILMKYLEQMTTYGIKPKKFVVKDFAALDLDIIDNVLDHNTFYYKTNRSFGFKKIRKTDLYLVPRMLVPFWLLKEYGGKII